MGNYLYEMLLILLGIMIGTGIGWWIMKAEGLVRVGWAVQNWEGDVMKIFVDRDDAIQYMDKVEGATRRAPIFIKTFKDRDPAGEP